MNEIMTKDPTTERLVKEIGLRTFADRYLDRDEEREVVRIANQLGVNEGEAAAIIVNACAETGIVREAVVRDTIRITLAYVHEKIDRAAFDVVVATGINKANKTLSEREVQRMVVAIMEETQRANVKRGWFSNWYVELKRELGIA